MVTRRPRSFSSRPRLEAVSPLPRLEATPPVTKRCLVSIGRDARPDAAKMISRGRCYAGVPSAPRTLRITAGSNQNEHRHRPRGPARGFAPGWPAPAARNNVPGFVVLQRLILVRESIPDGIAKRNSLSHSRGAQAQDAGTNVQPGREQPATYAEDLA